MTKPLRILVVEDEAILALDLEDALSDLGHAVVGVAASSRDAVRLATETQPDLALVDVHLLDGPTGVGVGRAIAALGHTAVLFMTANVKRIPDDFAGAFGVLPKPYTTNGLTTAVTFVRDALAEGAPPPPPWSLQLAPSFAADPDGQFRILTGG